MSEKVIMKNFGYYFFVFLAILAVIARILNNPNDFAFFIWVLNSVIWATAATFK